MEIEETVTDARRRVIQLVKTCTDTDLLHIVYLILAPAV